MKKSEFKNAEAEATKRQTFAIYCMAKTDVRNEKLTRWEASQLIGAMKKVKSQQEKLDAFDDFMEKRESNEVTKKLFAEEEIVVKPVSKKKRKSSTTRRSPKKTSQSEAVRLFDRAEAAGMKASKAVTPVPMVVAQHANVLDDSSPVVKQWDAPEGVCGMAHVVIKCKGAGVKFINGLKKAGIAGAENSFKRICRSSYHGGFYYHVHAGSTQSYERKRAFASAFAKVLADAGITCYTGSRLD
jgi:hypothetical protein